MLGTGISGDLREPAASAAATINEADATVVAVDVPSGFDADRGDHADNAVAADCVVTFHDAKPGVDDLAAEVSVADIGIPAAAERFVVGPGDIDLARPDGRAADRTLSAAVPTPARRRSRHRPRFGPAPNSPSSLRPSPSPARFRGIARISSSNRTRATFSRPSGPRTSSRRPNSTTTWSCWARLGTADETLEAARQFLESYTGRVVVDADALAVVPDLETDATLVCTPNRRELARMGGPDVDDLADVADEIEAFAAELVTSCSPKGARTSSPTASERGSAAREPQG